MGGLLGLIIICAVFAASIDKNNKKRKSASRDAEQTRSENNPAPDRRDQYNQRDQQNQQYQQWKKSFQQMKGEIKKEIQASQERNRKNVRETAKKTSSETRSVKQTPENDNILARSARNAEESFERDTLKQEAGHHENCVEGHYEASEDLMKQVEDLIVLGPNCSMSYERDFVAEGEKGLRF